jgi:bifunctional enzyme CysN/CysC
MDLAKTYILLHAARKSRAILQTISYQIDVSSLARSAGTPLKVNEIGRVAISSSSPLFLDPYQRNRATGNFILIDEETGSTVAAGMVLDRRGREQQPKATPTSNLSDTLHKEPELVTIQDRHLKSGFKPVTMWCTGLSGSGKSTIARNLEKALFDSGRPIFMLDGDTMRHGLNADLGFSPEARRENIRRTAHVARLLNQAGVSVVCALISPLQADRDLARSIIGSDEFLEIYVSTPLAVCESRDPHGLYQRARKGEIVEFTGVSAPYEAPASPALSINTSEISVEDAVLLIVGLIKP